ncbi:ATP-dependent RNA helicase HrpA [Candidatus Electrothrix aarhusensis]
MQLNYPSNLPITDRKDEIVQAIKDHQIIVIAGDTGSGKTTQLPKMCLEAGRAAEGAMIGCTQPRRIAALSVTERVQEELGKARTVGSKIRFQDRTGPATRIKFMTDGILLAETRGDRDLRAYDTLIIDEAHERSLNIDFLLGYLHQLLARRHDLKLIIASATIDTEKFSKHFHDAPIIQVEGRTYPVTTEYCPPDNEDDESNQDIDRLVADQVCALMARPGGDILAFLPTERDILDTVGLLRKELADRALILPLFGRLQGGEQRRIFRSAQQRKIIVATNVAETSITVPGIECVVDTGLARIAHYNVRAGTTHLPVTRIARASCDQRAGRCGRVGPGRCIRLYSEDDYLSRDEFTLPEIQRSNLAEVILQMLSLRLPEPRKFPFIDPPAPRAVNDGFRILRELGAIDSEHRLTQRGRIMARLPLDPRISRMIIEGAELGVLRETAIIAAALAIQDPRVQPPEKLEKARQAHRAFNYPGSDVLTLVNIWDACRGEPVCSPALPSGNGQEHRNNKGQTRGSAPTPSAGKLRRFCEVNFCSWQRMREWFDIYEQILRILKQHKEFDSALKRMGEPLCSPDSPPDNGQTQGSAPTAPALVHQALTAGFLRNIALRKEKNTYQISGNREAVLFPGSGLYNKGGQWIVAADFVHTSQLFARMAATIEVDWLERLGGDLCKRSYADPHWQKKSGQVTALEKVTLFGLVIAADRRVNYGRISKKTAAEAKEIFIRDALIPGELKGKYPFLEHNLALAQQQAELEERLRRRGIMTDEQVLYEFYDQRLGEVYDGFTLSRFLSRKRKQSKPGEQGDGFLWMTEQDLCQSQPESDELYRFPKTLTTPQGELRLHYAFHPGQEDDGVTVDIPVSCCPALSPNLFEWMVPGLLEEKVVALLKGLPKRLRKLFVPLPDTAAQLMDGLDLYQGSLYPALERLLLRHFQVRVTRADWQLDNLPLHLRMRFRLCDEQGKLVYCTRNFHELAGHCGSVQQAIRGGQGTKVEDLPERKNIQVWDFAEAPHPLPARDEHNRVTGLYYPALFLGLSKGQEQQLCLTYIADLEQAAKQNKKGLRFLYGQHFSKEFKALAKECKAAVAGHTASWLSLGLKAGAGETRDLLLNCIMDSLFQINGDLPDKASFDQVLADLREQGVTKLAREQLNQVMDLLAERRKTQVALTQSKQRASKSRSADMVRFAEYDDLLKGIVSAGFLTDFSSSEAGERKRWLRALAKRVERAEHSPHKDADKARRVLPFAEQLRQLERKEAEQKAGGSIAAPCREAVTQYRRMVEEFRISVFAPEIGTALPISEKRLKEQWQQVEESCRRVE